MSPELHPIPIGKTHHQTSRFHVLGVCVLGLLSYFFAIAQVWAAEVIEPPKVLPDDTVYITTNDWPPYVDVGAPDLGPLARVINRVFNEAGYKVKYVVQPWKRDKKLVVDGHADALMPAYCSPDRVKYYLCSEPLVTGKLVLFHRTDFPFQWKTVKDLEGLKIGATLGYYYGADFERMEKAGKLQILRIASDETNMRLLMMGRIQLFPQDEAVGYAMIKQLFPRDRWHDITNAPRPLHRESLYLLFTRATPRGRHLMDVFNKGLLKLRNQNQLQDMLQKLTHPEKMLHQP
ncbi:substrate-binding periplasmic protein [Mangrovitalea sediminis]|uniref:substrate-binding periplasmic protein n=1 Tax=Mangrovitalea sediminis TaxID=1982043 RepID=UPI000BE5C556|nr:transporter substrate-binding domain-containing protein [Mangrovitalea sediminis]